MCAQHMSRRDLNALIDNMTRKAIPVINNSHRKEFQSSGGGTSLFL